MDKSKLLGLMTAATIAGAPMNDAYGQDVSQDPAAEEQARDSEVRIYVTGLHMDYWQKTLMINFLKQNPEGKVVVNILPESSPGTEPKFCLKEVKRYWQV